MRDRKCIFTTLLVCPHYQRHDQLFSSLLLLFFSCIFSSLLKLEWKTTFNCAEQSKEDTAAFTTAYKSPITSRVSSVSTHNTTHHYVLLVTDNIYYLLFVLLLSDASARKRCPISMYLVLFIGTMV